MVRLNLLQSLSFQAGKQLLIEEGYLAEKELETDNAICDRVFLSPYCLYDREGNKLDRIDYAEFCNCVVDTEYTDGRMTWEPVKTAWLRVPFLKNEKGEMEHGIV